MANLSSFKQACPSCEAMVPIRDPKLVGRKIDCPKCKYRFVVEEPAEEVEEAEDADEVEMAEEGNGVAKKGKSGATQITNKKPANGKAVKGAAARRPDDDEDVEEAPAKKKKGGSAMLIAGIGLAAVAVIALAVGAVFLFSGDKKTDNKNSANASPTKAGPSTDEGAVVKAPDPEKEKPRPKQSDVSNLLPNDTHAVLNMPLEHLLHAPRINQALLNTPGAFQEAAFRRVWGIPPTDVSRMVLSVNAEKKTVFSVMRTRSALNQDKIIAALKLKPENAIDGLKYYLLTKPLDEFSTFLFQDALRIALTGGGVQRQNDKTAMYFMDPFTVVYADVGPMIQFLKDKEHPKHLSKSADEEETPSEGQTEKSNQPTGPGGGPASRRRGAPGAPGGTPGAPGGASGAGAPTPPGGPGAGRTGGNAPPGGKNAPGGPGGRAGSGPNAGMNPGRMSPGAMPQSMRPGSSSPSDPAPVSPSYLTVDPPLKAVLDQIEKVDKQEGQNLLLSVAISTLAVSVEDTKKVLDEQGAEIPKIPDPILKIVLESLQGQLKAAGIALTDFNESKMDVNAAAATKDAKLAKEWEKTASTTTAAVIAVLGLDMVAKNPPRTNTPNTAGMGPGGFRGMGMGMMGGFPNAQSPGGTAADERGKDGDYQIWTKEEVLALNFHFKMNNARYIKSSAVLEIVGVLLRGLTSLSDSRPRIHELAAAIQAYHEKEGHFPRGTVQRGDETKNVLGWPPDQRLSWLAQLLPYLGNGEFNSLIPESSKSWYEESTNQKIGFTVIPQFLASASRNTALITYPNLPTPGLGLWAATHFVGIAGVGLDAATYRDDDPATAKLRGVFGYDRETKKADIKDGLEQTIVAIQVPSVPRSPWIAGGGSTVRGVPDDASCVRPFVCAKYKKPDGKEEEGTFAIMADGKVRFIPASIDPKTFKALCTIAGDDMIRKIDAIAPEVPAPQEEAQQPVLKAEAPAPATPAPTPPVKSDQGQDLQKLQGSWVQVGGQMQGGVIPANLVREMDLKLEITGDKYVMIWNNKSKGDSKEGGILKLDETKSPKTLDAQITIGSLAGQTQQCIYSLTGDQFKWFVAKPGNPRPTGFITKAGENGRIIFVFKRAKP